MTDRLICNSCGGEFYHFAGCTIGFHGQIIKQGDLTPASLSPATDTPQEEREALEIVASEINDAIAAHDSGESVDARTRARHVLAAITRRHHAPPCVSQGAVRAAMEVLHIVGHSPSDDSLDLSAHVYLDDVLAVADRLDAEGE